ncbi:glycerate kinase type-2 family protein [Aquabacter spiritensis]|uniref:Hydroxypyruvate reductase/glycerate 2-kinase n=1 Tax=Aquabacter spiritensis TaxID=933073 RepID=A0A4R3LZA6_9HYPH|nr:glycerate kinase [Aquabacter spiritensis]TCT05626.1 hydroxypyruvate reductase/glycerate 2-kinase [Aquabacter spiritensis]
MPSDKDILLALFEAALGAALPEGKFKDRLPAPPKGRTLVLGAGKASARMARAFEAEWGRPCEGLVVTRYGHGCATRQIEIVEAAHPVPDAAGQDAARRILALARSAGPDDLVVCLMSGGASALLTAPAEGLTLEDKQALNTALLKSGAPIGVMNKVRKAVSAIKGGRLAAAIAPARCVTYLISDVPGDDPGAIGSGPTIPEASDPAAVLALMRRYGVPVSPQVEQVIRANRVGGDPLPGQEVHMIATPLMALEAAAAKARDFGLAPLILGDAIEGEAREAATVFAGIARCAAAHGRPLAAPGVLLSGGETTVTVRGTGRGGRNVEFLLALAVALSGAPGVSAIACDTDGVDGTEDNAGAWFDSTVLAAAEQAGLSPVDRLDDNDGYGFFAALGGLVKTGPTLTNVNDFRAILVR